MKQLRFVLPLLMAICLLLGAASAADSPAFRISTPDANPGETVQVTVSLVNNPGITSIRLFLDYDSDLTLTNITYNTSIGGMSQQPQTLKSPVVLLWISGVKDVKGDFTLATLTFRVSDRAAAGKKAITMQYDEDDVFNLAEESIAFAVQNGGVTVKGGATSSTASSATTPTTAETEAPKPTEQTAPQATFVDVAPTAWYGEAVSYVQQKGLMSGTGKDTFAPENTMTRAMLMTVLARYAGADTTGGATWYDKSMSWAKATGVSDGTNPNGSITREQLVTMLYRYEKSPEASGTLLFSDANNVSAWAKDAMRWAVANGIVTGMSNGTLAPQATATRAQVATILMRFCELEK